MQLLKLFVLSIILMYARVTYSGELIAHTPLVLKELKATSIVQNTLTLDGSQKIIAEIAIILSEAQDVNIPIAIIGWDSIPSRLKDVYLVDFSYIEELVRHNAVWTVNIRTHRVINYNNEATLFM